MTAGWKAKSMVEAGQRLAAVRERTQEQGRGLAELQRRMAAQAAGLRRLQEAAKGLAGLRGGR